MFLVFHDYLHETRAGRRYKKKHPQEIYTIKYAIVFAAEIPTWISVAIETSRARN